MPGSSKRRPEARFKYGDTRTPLESWGAVQKREVRLGVLAVGRCWGNSSLLCAVWHFLKAWLGAQRGCAAPCHWELQKNKSQKADRGASGGWLLQPARGRMAPSVPRDLSSDQESSNAAQPHALSQSAAASAHPTSPFLATWSHLAHEHPLCRATSNEAAGEMAEGCPVCAA